MGSPPGLPSPDGLPAAADVLVHVAGDPPEKRQSVQKGGGVCHRGDANRSGAHEFQADGAARLGLAGEGKAVVLDESFHSIRLITNFFI